MLKLLLGILLLLSAGNSLAASSFEIETIQDKHHITADRTLYHSNEKIYEAFGHVVVSSKGQRLSADYLWIDDATKEMKARGNVIFVDTDVTIQAAEIHFNLESGLGSVFYGKIFNDLYSLKGQLIRKVSEDRFLTTEGEYTTCKDCPESWKVAAKNVDFTVEGYAFMEAVFIKIKDIPTLFIPYLVIPVKTKRQTGLLFPRLGVRSTHGFVFMQPFFWAIDDHQDATFTFGKYSSRGLRYEGEYRYKSYSGIEGIAQYLRTEDRNFRYGSHPDYSGYRYAIKTEHEWPFHERFKMRWRVFEVGDREYPRDFAEDIQGVSLPALESNAVASSHFSNFFLSAEARRYRNLIYHEPIGFDTGTVQAVPTVHAGLKDQKVLGPLLFGFYGRFDNFTRHNGPFNDVNGNNIYDPNFNSTKVEYLREANRFLVSPELSAPFRLGPFLSIAPSLQFNQLHYSFSLPTANQSLESTSTQYVQGKVEASTVIEKVYDYDGDKVLRLKHQLSPFLSFSNIPWFSQENRHVFQEQLDLPNGLFDQYDIVPISNSTNFLRYPQGKSIYYGLTSRLIGRNRRPEEMPRVYPYDLLPAEKPKVYSRPRNRKQEIELEAARRWDLYNPHYDSYSEIWTVNVSQAYDFKEASRQSSLVNGDKKRAFSYLFARSDFNIENFTHYIEYKFFPRIVQQPEGTVGERVFSNKHTLSTALTWHWVKLQNLRKTRSFTRSMNLKFTNSSQPNPSRTVGGGLDWSANDFVNLTLSYNYDLLAKNQLGWTAQSLFAHPSECWGLMFRYDWSRTREPSHTDLGVQVLLNLMGTGFLGSGDLGEGGRPGGVFGGI